jgi:hypothetical protein
MLNSSYSYLVVFWLNRFSVSAITSFLLNQSGCFSWGRFFFFLGIHSLLLLRHTVLVYIACLIFKLCRFFRSIGTGFNTRARPTDSDWWRLGPVYFIMGQGSQTGYVEISLLTIQQGCIQLSWLNFCSVGRFCASLLPRVILPVLPSGVLRPLVAFGSHKVYYALWWHLVPISLARYR